MIAADVPIREARADDLQGIVAVDRLRAGPAEPAYWERILTEYALGGTGAARVALVAEASDGELQGFVFGEVRAWEFGSERCGWIFSVAVRPGIERRGLATRLCNAAIERFGSLGVGLVRTMVRRDDVPLLALFRSMGFAAGPFSEMERAVPTSVPREEMA